MISNADYLIQKYAEARETRNDANTETARYYWNGVMNTYHAILNESFPGWAERGTTGYYVFGEEMTYDEALNAVSKLVENC
jgi:hypothetical protein